MTPNFGKTLLATLERELLKEPEKVHHVSELVSRVSAKMVAFRIRTHISQEELARRAGLSPKVLNEIEGLVNTDPGLKSLSSLAKAMSISLEQLLLRD